MKIFRTKVSSNSNIVSTQFFYKHELLSPYKWYWRVEPDVEFLCPVEFDPFVYMIEHNKRYSFVIALQEIQATVRSLWSTVSKGMLIHDSVLLNAT